MRRRRRPPERRQVHAGQPDPRPPRGRRRGRARASPATGSPTTRSGPAAGSRSSTPAAGRSARPGIHLRVAEQAEVAVELADVVVFVVDATVGATDTDEAVVRLLRRAGKPVVLVANKVDDQRVRGGRHEPVEPRPRRSRGRCPRCTGGGAATCSTRSSRCCRRCRRSAAPTSEAARGAWHCSAGRTSASRRCSTSWPAPSGSSSTRSPARPRDPVDEIVDLGGKTWRFVDTAGIRRRVHQARGADFYASLRTQTALEKAEVAVVLIDAEEPIAEQDIRVIQQVVDAGRALVVAYNKWDLLDEERRHYLEREIERELVQIQWAPRVNLSARTGRHLDRLVPALELALDVVGDPRPDRPAQRLPRRDRRGPPAPGPRRQAAAHPLRDAGGDPAAAVRRLRVRVHRGGVPALPRAAAARGVRLRGDADRGVGAGPGEAAPLSVSGHLRGATCR